MSATEVFFDSNVLLYLTSSESGKAARARELLAAGGTVSVQTLNEFASVARRKFRMEWSELREILSTIRRLCDVKTISTETHDQGLCLSERYGFRIYDSMILASALQAGCRILLSEDMQDGQVIGALTIRNPFLAS